MLPGADVPIQIALTLDRGLRLELEPALLPFLDGWAPVATAPAPLAAVRAGAPTLTPVVTATGATPMDPAAGAVGHGLVASVVRVVRHRGLRPAAPREEPHLRLGSARCWMDDERGVALVHGASGGWATVTLHHAAAEVIAPETSTVTADRVAEELRAMCTIALALLAGRREGSLVAAAAVVAPDGGGWLVVGPGAGRSTTVGMLVTAGWGFLADELVLLHGGDRGGAWLEGWPRARVTSDTAGIARGRWRRTAPLAGIVSTHLGAGQSTVLARAGRDEALAALVLATPWLLADPPSTRYVLGLLRAASRVPGWCLRFGGDVDGDAVRLAWLLRPLEAAS